MDPRSFAYSIEQALKAVAQRSIPEYRLALFAADDWIVAIGLWPAIVAVLANCKDFL